MFKKYLVIIILCSSITALLYGQTPSSTTTSPTPAQELDPVNLPPGWWSNFQVEGQELQNRYDAILSKSIELSNGLSEADKEKAKTLVEEIKKNFQAYIKTSTQPLPSPPPTPAVSQVYSIERLIELNNDLQKKAIDIQTFKNEQSDLKSAINNLQNQIDLTRQKYQEAENRSASKVINALEILSIQPLIETDKKKYQINEKTIEIENLKWSFLTEEIALAKKRLISDPNELEKYARLIEPARVEWTKSKQERQRIDNEIIPKILEEQTEENETQNQYFDLQIMEANINEIKAHNRYVRSEIIYTLAKILNKPNEIDQAEIRLSFREWENLLSRFKQQTSDWLSQSQRSIERASRLLTLHNSKSSSDSSQHTANLSQILSLSQKNMLAIRALNNQINETLFLNNVINEINSGANGKKGSWIYAITDTVQAIFIFFKEQGGKTLFYIGTHPINLVSIFQFILILVITWWISHFIQRGLSTLAKSQKGIRQSVVYRLNRLFQYGFFTIGMLIALTSIGFDFSNLILVAGALGVGVGFALQSVVRDFISGIIILFQGHLKVGDYIETPPDIKGEIREINIRSTVIMTNDGLEVIIPNSQIISTQVTNWTLKDPYRRVRIPFSVAYGSDLDEVSRVVLKAANGLPSTLQKIGINEPCVYLSKFGDNGIEMELIVWVNEKWTRKSLKTRSAYLWAIEKALKKSGFVIPFPQRDVYLKNVTSKNENETENS